jgi:DNA-directed RNA polymerase subunit alpha
LPTSTRKATQDDDLRGQRPWLLTSEANKIERKINTIGVISTDSNYSPVVKVAYAVEPTRVEHDSKFDKLTLEVTTNGSVKPHEAVAMAAQLFVAHFNEFTKLDDVVKSYKLVKEEVKTEENKYQDMMIEELDLSVRSNNCLSALASPPSWNSLKRARTR